MDMKFVNEMEAQHKTYTQISLKIIGFVYLYKLGNPYFGHKYPTEE